MEFLLVLAVIAVIVFVVIKKRSRDGNNHISDKRSRGRVSPAAVSKDQASFRATKIVAADKSCQAARELQGKLFLDSELNTPKLPLPECTQISDCRCKYEHLDDRRSGEDDRRLHSLQTELYPTANKGVDRRRSKRGRRSTD